MVPASTVPSHPSHVGNRPHTLSSLVDADHENHPDEGVINPSLYAGPALTSAEALSLSKSRHREVWTRTPLVYTTSKFVAQGRTTHSDVMSISNTVRSQRSQEMQNQGGGKFRAKFPQSADPAAGANNMTNMTRTEAASFSRARKVKGKELHAERAVFLARLKGERDDRASLETTAAVTVQKYTRGFLQRPRSDFATARKDDRWAARLMENTRKVREREETTATERAQAGRLRNERRRRTSYLRSEHTGWVAWRWASLSTPTQATYMFWVRGACHQCVYMDVNPNPPNPAEPHQRPRGHVRARRPPSHPRHDFELARHGNKRGEG